MVTLYKFTNIFNNFQIITKDDKKVFHKKPGTKGGNKNFSTKNRNKVKTGKRLQKNTYEESSDKKETQEEAKEEKETLDIWFDNVDPILLDETQVKEEKKTESLKNVARPASSTLIQEESSDG